MPARGRAAFAPAIRLGVLLLSAAALPVSWQCSLISVYRGTHQCGECNNAAFGTQSAAQLPSLAPHDSKARLQTKTNRRGSWRSHVHRTRLRSACSSLSPAPTMAGSRGKAPCVLLGNLKGAILSRERMAPLSASPARCREKLPPASTQGRIQHSVSKQC